MIPRRLVVTAADFRASRNRALLKKRD